MFSFIRLKKVLNKRKSTLDIFYPDDEGRSSAISKAISSNHVTNTTIALTINGKLKHTIKRSEKNFLESITFPSGRVLR